MSRIPQRAYVGGGQYRPERHEVERWQDFVERRTTEIEVGAIAKNGDYESLEATYDMYAGSADTNKFYSAAREYAIQEAYKRFGFTEEHF